MATAATACASQKRVRGDDGSGGQRVADRRSGTRAVAPDKATRLAKCNEPAEDEEPAEQREPRRSLGEDNDGACCRDRRARAARQRVDEREVAGAITPLQEQEVAEVRAAAAEQERQLAKSEGWRRDQEHCDGHGRVEGERQRERQPQKQFAAAGTLEEQVPGRMTRRRREDESEGDWRHTAWRRSGFMRRRASPCAAAAG
jgi:hypothetical protein